MKTSEKTATLAAALAKAQSEFPMVAKNCEVSYGNTKFRYADLASIIEATRPVLNENGLSITQNFSFSGEYCVIQTSLLHTSGERIDGDGAIFKIAGLKPQEIGSWITYWRRYQRCAIIDLCADDDTDAVELSGKTTPPQAKRPETNKPKETDVAF